MSTSTITRRAALTGTAAGAAAIVAGTGAALANDHDRAEWLALWQRWLDQCRRDNAAGAALEAAADAAKAAYPEQDLRWMTVTTRTVPGAPDVHTWMPGYSHIYHAPCNHTASSIEGYYDHVARIAEECGGPWNLERWREASMEDLSAWEAECRAIDERFNVPALRAASEREEARIGALVDEIRDRPANCVTGVAVKIALGRWLENEDDFEWACDDVLRLAGVSADMGREDLS